MYVVIVGCSEAGYHLTKSLLAAGYEVVVVDKDRARCQLLNDEVGTVALEGDGTQEKTLKLAGAARADVVVAVTGRDETNLVACQVAKHVFRTPRTVARIKDLKNDPIFHILGVDVVVNASHLVLTSLEEGIPGRPLLHLMNLRAPGAELVSISIPEDAAVVGKRVGELELPPNTFVSLVVKASGAQRPAAQVSLEGGDEVLAVTVTSEEQALYEILTGVD